MLSIASFASSYIPEVISQAWEPQRDVAHIRLPTTGVPALTGILTDPNSPTPIKIMILTGDGFYYTYSLDPTSQGGSGASGSGGELKLIKEHSLLTGTTDPPPLPRVL